MLPSVSETSFFTCAPYLILLRLCVSLNQLRQQFSIVKLPKCPSIVAN